MFKTRSKLLIALVLVGALGAAVGSAQADMVKLGDPSGAHVGPSDYQPGSAPDASGEPDKPDNGASRLSMNRGGSEPAPVMRSDKMSTVSLAEVLRWTWVIWLARYLNQTP